MNIFKRTIAVLTLFIFMVNLGVVDISKSTKAASNTVEVTIELPEDLTGWHSDGNGSGYDTADVFKLPDTLDNDNNGVVDNNDKGWNDTNNVDHSKPPSYFMNPFNSNSSEIWLHSPRNENYEVYCPANGTNASSRANWDYRMYGTGCYVDDWDGRRAKAITKQEDEILNKGRTFTVIKTKDSSGKDLPKPVTVTVQGSDLHRSSKIFLHSWRTYPQMGASGAIDKESTWTKHPTKASIEAAVSNGSWDAYTEVGTFLAYYTYDYTIHYETTQTINLSKGTINYYYKDLGGNTISSSDSETDLDISSDYAVSSKIGSYQKTIAGFTYQSVDMSIPTLNSTNTTADVTYYYKANDASGGSNPSGGDISFNPSNTNWTNQGKIAEGVGSYPVNVSYVGQNPAMGTATVTWNHNEPVPDKVETTTSGTPPVTTTKNIPQPPIIMTHDGTFAINYPLSSISVNGAANGSFGGTGGTVNITQQGGSLQLSGSGLWGAVVQETPSPLDAFDAQGGMVIPPAPANPQGNSGTYKLDWTKPEYFISSKTTSNLTASNGWSMIPYNFNYTLTDPLSGVRNGTYSIMDSSYYGRSQNGNSNSKAFNLQDGIYNFGIAYSDNANNTGNETAGTYYVDTIDPTDVISPRSTNNRWVNTPFTYSYSLADNLSGVANGTYSLSDSSHYGRSQSGSSTGRSFTLNDGIYNFGINYSDVATHTNSDSSGTYYVDTINPTISFNVAAGIFSTARGAVRKPSVHGIDDGFYGNITVNDNLSGIARLDYAWTYGSNDAAASYKTIYTSPYTLNDRYTESITKEIEKPVGDNLYLHVKTWDVAGNYTYQSFGPYEDPIRLYDFEVTDVRDVNWTKAFWETGLTKRTELNYKANKLPIGAEWGDNPVYLNAKIKKGYAFYFDVSSEYMYRDDDKIEVIPTLYYFDGKTRTPVDLYYNLSNNPFIKRGSAKDTIQFHMMPSSGKISIGNMSKLTLIRQVRVDKGNKWSAWKNKLQYTDGKIQWWYGKFFIPESSIFTKSGVSPRPENLLKGKNSYIIVNFQIIAYKNGIETSSSNQTFTYVPTQWIAEGGPRSSKYSPGDVILYDNMHSAIDDTEVDIIH